MSTDKGTWLGKNQTEVSLLVSKFSADKTSYTGNATGQTFGTVTSYTAATPAIALTDTAALLDATSNGVAATLAAGTEGQVIYVKATNVDNAVTLVPASFTDGTTITFTPVDEYIVLLSDGTNWNVVGGNAAIT